MTEPRRSTEAPAEGADDVPGRQEGSPKPATAAERPKKPPEEASDTKARPRG